MNGRLGRLSGFVAIGLVAVLSITATVYLFAGIAGAYLAADDFQWLMGGCTFHWSRVVNQLVGDHFYRPIIDIWFASATRACGASTSCYHLSNLGIHLLTVSMVFLLALILFDDRRIACLGALLFALQPGYAQAVVWTSAVTGLLMTTFYVASLLIQAMSWRYTGARRAACDLLAVAAFGAAIFSHEAAVTLPAVSWIMWTLFGRPQRLARRRTLAGGLAAGVALFAAMTVVANRRNTLFTESHYTIGVHMLRHALDYVVTLYIGPNGWVPYVESTLVIALLIAATPATRFGALWLIISLLPYLGFTSENTSRYLYLPSIGFSLAVAGALAAGSDGLSRRWSVRPRLAAAGFWLVGALVAIRFARFDYASIRSQVQSMEPWRVFADELARSAPSPTAGVVHVRPPRSELIEARYLDSIVRWVYQDCELNVIIDR
jgi:hypothetical protein